MRETATIILLAVAIMVLTFKISDLKDRVEGLEQSQAFAFLTNNGENIEALAVWQELERAGKIKEVSKVTKAYFKERP